jgi:hypothetical protein
MELGWKSIHKDLENCIAVVVVVVVVVVAVVAAVAAARFVIVTLATVVVVDARHAVLFDAAIHRS